VSAPKGSKLQCSRCRQYGHNRRGCGTPLRKRPSTTKAQSLNSFYRLDYADYLAMLEKGCGLCGRDLHDRTPDVDHDHSCDHAGKGKAACRACVRGLLCRSCNLRVGKFEAGLNLDADVAAYLGAYSGAPLASLSSMRQEALF